MSDRTEVILLIYEMNMIDRNGEYDRIISRIQFAKTRWRLCDLV